MTFIDAVREQMQRLIDANIRNFERALFNDGMVVPYVAPKPSTIEDRYRDKCMDEFNWEDDYDY